MIRALRRWLLRQRIADFDHAIAAELRRAENLPRALSIYRQEIASLQMRLDRLSGVHKQPQALLSGLRKEQR